MQDAWERQTMPVRMRNEKQGSRPTPGERGFALVVVIAMTTLLAVVAFVFTASVRSTIRSVHADVAAAEAESLAGAGITLALLDLTAARRDDARRRFPIDGSARTCRLPEGDLLSVRVRDEAGRIDLNVGKDELLRALFIGLGLSAPEADARVDAIGDYKDSDDGKRLNGAELDDYLDAGRPAGPKNAPFASVDELSRVIGFDSNLVGKILPHVTIHSGQEGIDPDAASPELVALLAAGSKEDGAGLDPLDFGGNSTLPPQFVTASVKRTFGIEADVRTARGARFVREAIVGLFERRLNRQDSTAGLSLDERPGPTYRLWRWKRGEIGAREPATAEPPPC